ncbi:hypothetical protein BH24ACT3_BH24ACT3_03110 [soil metagenome]
MAAATLGVRTYGTGPTGVREWYRADAWRRVRTGWAAVAGTDLGPVTTLHPPVRFGFSEPPRRPSIVSVRPLLEDPSGRLAAVVRDAEHLGVTPATVAGGRRRAEPSRTIDIDLIGGCGHHGR